MALWDLQNSDCVVVMGSNMAENHPIGFRFVVEAQRRGAKLIHIDPRFTRTSALADIHAPIRSGSDIAFLGGLIHHVIENDLWFRDYALNYTNLAHIITDTFVDSEDNEGVFSGFDPVTKTYDHESWQYQGEAGAPDTDPTLQHPNCVYQILKRHYARYTPERVEQVTGCPKETFLKVADTIANNSGRERTTAVCYAVGWTHHSYGVQIIRAAALFQALMGNMGRPGGGIMALRGHVSIQGSTDIPTLYNMLPGYLDQPNLFAGHVTLDDYLRLKTPPTGWWANTPKYVVSLLKAWYGEAATADNEWGFQFLPKLTSDASQEPMTLSMAHGVVKGQFILGQNPLVGAVNSELVEAGLSKLEWLVVRDFAMTETSDFWRNGRRVQKGQIAPDQIGTEVFFLPASMPGEKEGSVTNTSRLVQWHDWVCDAPGESRSDLWFMYHLGLRLKALYADSTLTRDRAIQALTWNYATKGQHQEPEAEEVLKEINGKTVADGAQLATFTALKADGSTSAGCWIYTGIYPAAGKNLALLAEQVALFEPQVSASAADGQAGLYRVAVESGADIVLAATDGAVAFDAVFAAVDAGIDIAIANKELVVAAGELLFAHAKRSGAKLLPVDSEHSAIFQCLEGQARDRVAGIVLTASGGPFWNRTSEEMQNVTVADALRHPTWNMGVKNTIDSASLMNKGLEVIEASRFFAMPAEQIHVLVHRTSVAHGFAIFTDGNVLGQFAPPDMRLPIGYALAYPDRLPDRNEVDALVALGGAAEASATALGFERPDLERFPCLGLAYDALRAGGTVPAALSAANEIVVAAFVDGRIRFGDIAPCIAAALREVPAEPLTLDAVRRADAAARDAAIAATGAVRQLR